MDPFSITASVLRITGSCFGAAHTLWEIRQAWKRAPVTVTTLCSQLKVTAASLSQIQSLLLGDTDVLRHKPDLIETFDTTLTSCMVLSTLLESFVLKIKKGTLEGTKATWKTKFKTIWNEDEVKNILQQLSTQQEAIIMLVSLLQMDSISEIKRLVTQHDTLLREIAANTRAARKTHSVEAPASILGTDEASQSIFSQLIDIPNDGRAEFEMAILSSEVYTRAFTGVLEPAADDDVESDNAPTLIELGPSSCLIELQNLVQVVRPKYVSACTIIAKREATESARADFQFRDKNVIVDITKVSDHKFGGREFDGRVLSPPLCEPCQEFDRRCGWLHVDLRTP